VNHNWPINPTGLYHTIWCNILRIFHQAKLSLASQSTMNLVYKDIVVQWSRPWHKKGQPGPRKQFSSIHHHTNSQRRTQCESLLSIKLVHLKHRKFYHFLPQKYLYPEFKTLKQNQWKRPQTGLPTFLFVLHFNNTGSGLHIVCFVYSTRS
jgi:hypothetical protein